MDALTKPEDSKHTLELNDFQARPGAFGPATPNIAGQRLVLSRPEEFPDRDARVRMDNVLWHVGLKRYSVCPAPRIETEEQWRARVLGNVTLPARDPLTGRFVAAGETPQNDLPLPTNLNELNDSLQRVKVPKRQSKRRHK